MLYVFLYFFITLICSALFLYYIIKQTNKITVENVLMVLIIFVFGLFIVPGYCAFWLEENAGNTIWKKKEEKKP